MLRGRMMKRLFVVLFVFALLAVGYSQTTAQIGDIKGFKNRAIRTAFENIGSQTKTVSGVWTFSATPVFSGGQTVTGTTTLGNGATITNSHADTVKVTESVVQINGELGIGSAPSVTITDVSRPAVGVLVLTIDGEDWMLFKSSDSTGWKN
jgi:hypothetical protein